LPVSPAEKGRGGGGGGGGSKLSRLEGEEVEERYTLWEALEVVVEESVFQAYCHNLMKQKEETMLLEINAIHSS